MERVSVVLITLNEEHNIDRCLGSVSWADEIIVVDSFSRDGTVEAARRYTEHVYQHEYPGSSRQCERGISYATGDWILILDADEEVSGELAAQIQEIVRDPEPAAERPVGYDILRKVMAYGRWIEGCGWFPDYQFRFFRKDACVAEHQEVHGGFTTEGRRGRLDGLLYHYTYDTIYSHLARINDYTSLDVANKLRRDPEAQAPLRKLLFSPIVHFFNMFFRKKGYRDGYHGFVLSLLDGVGSLVLYAKLWEYRMRQKEGKGELPPITNFELNEFKRRL